MNEELLNWLVSHNARNITFEEVQEIQALWDNFDVTKINQIIFLNGWSEYEEYSHLMVFLGNDEKIYLIESAHSVMVSDNTPIITECSVAVAEEAIQDMNKAIHFLSI